MNVNMAFCVIVIFIIFNVIERKYIAKEDINTKKLIKQSLLVGLSTLAAEYAMGKLRPDVLTNVPTQAFTSEPSF